MESKIISQQEYEQWKHEHCSAIGGSDAGAIMSQSPWGSLFSVWKEKMYGKVRKESSRMRAGIVLESAIAQDFQNENENFYVSEVDGYYIHPKYDFILGKIDRLIQDKQTGEKYVLECKNTGIEHRSEWMNGNIPTQYYWQGIHYLLATGYSRVYFHCLIGGNEFVTIMYDRKDVAGDMLKLLTNEIAFWDYYIIPKTPPPADGSDATTSAINAIPKETSDDALELDEKLISLLEERDTKKRLADQYLEESNEISNRIKLMLPTYGKYVNKQWSLSYTKRNTKRFDQAALKENHPDIYNKFIVDNEYVVISCRKLKVKE